MNWQRSGCIRRVQLGECQRAPVGGAGASIRQFDLFGGTAQPRTGGGADLGEQGIRRLEHRRPAEHRRTADPPSTVERDANAP